MANRRHLGVLLLVAGVWMAWMALPCSAQSKPPAGAAAVSTGAPRSACSLSRAPCGTTPVAPSGKPDTAEKFPFPGEASPSTTPSISGVPDAPDATGAPAHPAAKDFPFPGDADKPGCGRCAKGASSSSSSSSSASDDDATPADPNAGAAGAPGPEGCGQFGQRLRRAGIFCIA